MSRLEVKRLDSPLARSTRGPRDPAEDEQPHEEQREAPPRPKRRPTAERSKPRLASVPQAPPDATAASPESLDGLPDPPGPERVARASLHPAPDLAASIALRADRRAADTRWRAGIPEGLARARGSRSHHLARRICAGPAAPSPGWEPRSTHTAPGATPQPPKRYGHRRRLANRRKTSTHIMSSDARRRALKLYPSSPAGAAVSAPSATGRPHRRITRKQSGSSPCPATNSRST